ncbi:MAG: DUF1801 domain-containing protein [Anaerolineales bacterium]|nr:DUF1801 domain-containing protein [Anaerolineales bacterium]MCW5855971.1 DUF1801 domain-containing protein [Anaerolineales bacterium]
MPSQNVDAYLERLDHPLKPVVEALRAVILAADAGLNERIKWNAPSFGYADQDRITFMLRDADKVRLIFHRGARAEGDAAFSFEDPSGLVEWVNNERGTVVFTSLDDAQAQNAALADLVRAWMQATS